MTDPIAAALTRAAARVPGPVAARSLAHCSAQERQPEGEARPLRIGAGERWCVRCGETWDGEDGCPHCGGRKSRLATDVLRIGEYDLLR